MGDLDRKHVDAWTISHALEFMAEHHEGQMDKCGEPYTWHPIRVALAVRAAGYPVDHQVVALLHDVLEDTKAKPTEVRAFFGWEVLEAVDAITRRAGETYRQFIERCALHLVARVVKLYDIGDNSDPSRKHAGYPASRYAEALEFLERTYGLTLPRKPDPFSINLKPSGEPL